MSVNSVKKIILNFKVAVYSALKYCKTSHKYTLLLTRYSSSFTIRYIYYTVHFLNMKRLLNVSHSRLKEV